MNVENVERGAEESFLAVSDILIVERHWDHGRALLRSRGATLFHSIVPVTIPADGSLKEKPERTHFRKHLLGRFRPVISFSSSLNKVSPMVRQPRMRKPTLDPRLASIISGSGGGGRIPVG